MSILDEEELSAIRVLVKEWGSGRSDPHAERRHKERSERVSERAEAVLLKSKATPEIKLSRRKLLAVIAADADIQMSALMIVAVGAWAAKYVCY